MKVQGIAPGQFTAVYDPESRICYGSGIITEQTNYKTTMEDRISLHVLGLSYSQLQSGAYALILAEDRGPRRIPVIIGAAEAQSIAITLEGIRTPRPLTHDLFVSFAHAFGVKLREVFIYRFEDGIFSSELTFGDGTGQCRSTRAPATP